MKDSLGRHGAIGKTVPVRMVRKIGKDKTTVETVSQGKRGSREETRFRSEPEIGIVGQLLTHVCVGAVPRIDIRFRRQNKDFLVQ